MVSAERRRYLLPLILTAILASGFLFRNWFSRSVMPPPERMQAETTQSYRYARMVSMEGGIPGRDSLAMHPRGMVPSQNSIFEEYLAGGMHRIIGGDFDDFIRLFSLAFPLLTAVFLYLWMRAASYSSWKALAGAAVYTVLFPALLRARGGSLYRETVALPILTALGWLVERILSREDGRVCTAEAAAAGAVLFIALAAWKVTSFLAFFLFLYLFWRNWRRGDVPPALRISLAAAQVTASLLLTHMRHDFAILSPASVMAILALIPPLKPLWFPLLGTAASAASSFIGGEATGHVSAVVFAKLRFLFSHPEDPALLSEDARLFWVPGYTTPSFAQILLFFGIPAAAALMGIRDFIRKRRSSLLFWFFFLSLAGYLFFDRLLVFLAVALVPVIVQGLRKRWYILPLLALLILQSAFPSEISRVLSGAGLEFRFQASLLNDRQLDSFLSWTRQRTEEDSAFLSYWHISGLITAYANRPVVTHTFFENAENRRTIVDFAERLFMPEDSLVTMMRRRQCDYLVYQADFLMDRSSSGLLYLAGLTEVPDDAAAIELQYRNWELDSLTPVFSGPSLRVFRLGTVETDATLPRQFLFEERYRHCYRDYEEAVAILYDPRAASGPMADAGLEMNDPDMLSAALLLGVSGGGPQEVTARMLNDLIQLYIQGSYGLDSIAEDIETFLYWCGRDPELRLLLARFYAAEGRIAEAEEQYRKVLEEDPGNTQARSELNAAAGMEVN